MGCGGSKLDEMQAVALCRDRARLLSDAMRAQQALALSHAAYANSLRSLAPALRNFLTSLNSLSPPSSPQVHLPTRRKPPPSPLPYQSDNNNESDSDSHADVGPTISRTTRFNFHYARAGEATPSVYVIEPPPAYFDSTGYNTNAYYSSSYYNYGNFYQGKNEYFESSCSSSYPPPPPAQAQEQQPPSPPRTSAWDFLNFFEPCENYYYAPRTAAACYDSTSRSSREVREEEGIPNLEEDDDSEEENEVVKQVYAERYNQAGNFLRRKRKDVSRNSPSTDGDGENDSDCCTSCCGECPHCDVEEKVIDKNVVSSNASGWQPQDVTEFEGTPKHYGNVAQVVDEIELQFNKTSDAADDLSRMLEVAKNTGRYRASRRSFRTSSNNSFYAMEEEREIGSSNLSKTLQKLYMWEKKLHAEVRGEEKMRVLLNKYSKQLKRLDKKGAEAQKIEATRTMIHKLSIRIRIAIQFVDSISKKINKLRDEELWPQIRDLIHGFMRMWRSMLECHRTQFEAISDAKNLNSRSDCGKLNDVHVEATRLLELEMLNWIANFSDWVNAQRNHIRLLNSWLIKSIHHDSMKTVDGIVHFSPGRLGAPPIFVICNYWSKAMDRTSEKEVVDAMQSFAADVIHLWQQHHLERRQRVMANLDMGSELKTLEREEHQMRRAINAQSKKLALVSGQNRLSLDGHRDLVQWHSNEGSCLQSSLRQLFETLQNFTSNSMMIYQELHDCFEDERLRRGNTQVP